MVRRNISLLVYNKYCHKIYYFNHKLIIKVFVEVVLIQ